MPQYQGVALSIAVLLAENTMQELFQVGRPLELQVEQHLQQPMVVQQLEALQQMLLLEAEWSPILEKKKC